MKTASCPIAQLDDVAFETAVLGSPLPVFLHFAILPFSFSVKVA